MTIGEIIHFFRFLHGFKQKYPGKMLGFNDMQPDVRIAQYEKGVRSPKETLWAKKKAEAVKTANKSTHTKRSCQIDITQFGRTSFIEIDTVYPLTTAAIINICPLASVIILLSK